MTSDGTNTLTWDRAGRLLNFDGVDNAYNGLGQRVQQTVSSVVTEYLLDVQPGLAVVLSETAQSQTKRFIHGPRGIHSFQDNSGDWAWMIQDGLNSVRGQADAGFDGQEWGVSIHATRETSPFGIEESFEGTFDTNYHFTGEPRDANGLSYLRARHYNPALGVFPSLDPFEGVIQRTMSLNGYSWVEGNVVNNVDPSGNVRIPTNFCDTGVSDIVEPGSSITIEEKLKRATVRIALGNFPTRTGNIGDPEQCCDPSSQEPLTCCFVSSVGKELNLGTLTFDSEGIVTHDHYGGPTGSGSFGTVQQNENVIRSKFDWIEFRGFRKTIQLSLDEVEFDGPGGFAGHIIMRFPGAFELGEAVSELRGFGNAFRQAYYNPGNVSPTALYWMLVNQLGSIADPYFRNAFVPGENETTNSEHSNIAVRVIPYPYADVWRDSTLPRAPKRPIHFPVLYWHSSDADPSGGDSGGGYFFGDKLIGVQAGDVVKAPFTAEGFATL